MISSPLALSEVQISPEIQSRARPVKLAVFDVDGVLTDGSLWFGETGETLKVFNSFDGHGLRMLKEGGVELAIITGRSTRALEHRARELGIIHVSQGVQDKIKAFESLRDSLGLILEEIAAIGDDVVDLPILTRCGFAACVPAAPSLVKQRVHYVTQAHGGHGAVREFCELILQAQGKLDGQLKRYLA